MGYQLEFSEVPPDNAPPVYQEESLELHSQVEELLQKGAIEETQGTSGFFSQIFLVPKKDGGWRPVINLKSLNRFISVKHFKMETILSLRGTLREGDFMAFERRLSNGPYPPRPQTISEVHFSGEAISVQDAPLRFSHGSKGFHKAPETSGLYSQSFGHSPYSLHRRHFDHGELPYRDYRECTKYNSSAGEPGFHYQLEQECPKPKSNNGIPWVAGGFNLTHSVCSKIQAIKDCQGMSPSPTQGPSIREGPCSYFGPTDICKYSSPPRPPSLQGITTTEAYIIMVPWMPQPYWTRRPRGTYYFGFTISRLRMGSRSILH